MPYRACKMLLPQRLFSVACTDFFSSFSCSQKNSSFWRFFFLVFFWSSKHSLFFNFLHFFLAVKLKLHFFQKRLWCACVLGLGFRLFHFFWKVLFLFFGLLGAFLGPSFGGLQTKGQTLGWVCVPSSYFNMVIRQWDVEARKKGQRLVVPVSS